VGIALLEPARSGVERASAGAVSDADVSDGVLIERVAVRPFFRAASPAWLLSTIACGIIAENAARDFESRDIQRLVEPGRNPRRRNAAGDRLRSVRIEPIDQVAAGASRQCIAAVVAGHDIHRHGCLRSRK
jgi:hypothetical protein